MNVRTLIRNFSGAAPANSASLELIGEEPLEHVDQLIAAGRYALLLDVDGEEEPDEKTQALAWLQLERKMAFVPAPELQEDDASTSNIPALYLDRFAVSNADFARFVEDDGYGQTELWPQSIWANVLQFVDSTGYPAPRFWHKGDPPDGEELHPVVGVNWFEARAFALWSGKRLPTSREWQHAASWTGGRDGRSNRGRYPWGNTFDPKRTNTWTGGPGFTIPVDQLESGCTPNGIYQLIGNVWEWVATQYEYVPNDSQMHVAFEEPMVEIRGAAFDTYFETQATCQFRTGQPFLYRGANVGFRCCLAADQLTEPPPPTAFV